MRVLNFSHPLTDAQRAQLADLDYTIDAVIDVPVAIDFDRPLPEQIAALADATGLTPADWQAGRYIVNPPGMSLAAAPLMAEIHGRSGHFPALLALKRGAGGFEAWAVIDVQGIREAARGRRF